MKPVLILALLSLAACAFTMERLPERHVSIREAPMTDLPPAFRP